MHLSRWLSVSYTNYKVHKLTQQHCDSNRYISSPQQKKKIWGKLVVCLNPVTWTLLGELDLKNSWEWVRCEPWHFCELGCGKFQSCKWLEPRLYWAMRCSKLMLFIQHQKPRIPALACEWLKESNFVSNADIFLATACALCVGQNTRFIMLKRKEKKILQICTDLGSLDFVLLQFICLSHWLKLVVKMQLFYYFMFFLAFLTLNHIQCVWFLIVRCRVNCF